MPEVADAFRRFAGSYVAAHGAAMLPSHRRAIADIIACRTEALARSRPIATGRDVCLSGLRFREAQADSSSVSLEREVPEGSNKNRLDERVLLHGGPRVRILPSPAASRVRTCLPRSGRRTRGGLEV